MNNPLVKSAFGMTLMDLTSLSNALNTILGFSYGYAVQKLEDVGVTSFTLTLCNHKRKLSNDNVSLIEVAIQAWGMGHGCGLLEISWPERV